MRPLKVSQLFLSLLSVVFALVVLFASAMIYRFAQFSSEGSRLAQTLQETLELNRGLRRGIDRQMELLYTYMGEPGQVSGREFNAINFELGELQNRYLTLEIGGQERLTVEQIKALQRELTFELMQLVHLLRFDGNGPQLNLRFRRVLTLVGALDQEFETLHDLQTSNLEAVLARLSGAVGRSYLATGSLAVGLMLVLGAFTFLLRRRVLQPLGSLLMTADQIRQGNLAARAPALRHDELGELARRFNFMADSLADSYASLERMVEERTAQLRQVQQQLVQSEKMSAMGQLVGGVAHELNNPLTAVIGFAELMKEDLVAAGADRGQIQILERIVAQTERCTRIVTNLLHFARQREPQLQAVRLDALVEPVLQLREYELTTRNIALVRDYDPDNPVVHVDPHKIQQVVLNLLNNAHDAIQEVGSPGTIWVRTRSAGDSVTIVVEDEGTGIEELDRVFDPFYTTKEVGKGTGLGLSVCYGVVQEHGGDIQAQNWERGARFTVTLPKGDPGRSGTCPEPLAAEPRPAAGRRSTALVVEDEADLVDLQGSILARMGLDVVGARSAEEAISILEARRVDLVISDVRMPGELDGLQLYAWVRRHQPWLGDRFLLISGDVVGLESGWAGEDPPPPSIAKPFNLAAYSQMVRELLED